MTIFAFFTAWVALSLPLGIIVGKYLKARAPQ
jgi:hypothetical protein